MGGLKDKYLGEQEDHYIRLADALGISWDELIALDYEVSANISKDGLIYGCVVTFSKENDEKLLEKISGLDKHLAVNLPSWALERSAHDEYEFSAIFDNTKYKSSFLNENFGAPYAVELMPFISPIVLPCQQPHWGMVAGADLRTGEVVWQHRNGTVRDLAPLPLKLGVPDLGGPVMTAGGVAFMRRWS